MVDHKYHFVWILAIFLVAACSASKPASKNDFKNVVDGLQIQTYGEATKLDEPVIIVFLHGDSCVADYMKPTAELVVQKNVLSIIMARTGCEVSNRSSKGSHGADDHYTPERINSVSTSINSLKQHYKASKVYLIGHSGGAATAAIVAGINPNLINGFVAVSFPANVPKWRLHRDINRNKGKTWENSLSPHEFINKIKSSTLIAILNGSNDKNTPPHLSEDYVRVAKARGLNINNIILDGENHNSSFNSFRVRKIINSFINE